MKFFSPPTVRRFAISLDRWRVVAKEGKKLVELCDLPYNMTEREIKERADEFANKPVPKLVNRRADSDIIAKTLEGKPVSTVQVENVFTDWLLLNSVCCMEMYEHVANAHELQVLEIARKMFGA